LQLLSWSNGAFDGGGCVRHCMKDGQINEADLIEEVQQSVDASAKI